MLEGQIIKDQYYLTELLGVGGFAGVFRTDEVIKDICLRVIATKLIPIDNAGNSDKQLQELQAGLSCDHPNLLRCYGAGETTIGKQSFLYLLMELAEETLQQRLERGNVSTEESIAIFKDITEGLIYLHQKNQIHLDLKPANFLKVNGKWKIGDYGLVRSINPAQSYAQTVNSIGTPLFVPPESYQNIISSGWDIWSLGIILTTLLTGKYPIQFESPNELKEKIINVQLDNLELDGLDQCYKDIIGGCLIKDRQKRLTAEQVKNILVSVNTNSQSFIPSNVIPNPNNISRRNFLITAGLAGVTITISSGMIIYAHSKDRESNTSNLKELQPSELEKSQIFKETLPDNIILEMLKIPAGNFLMGSPINTDKILESFFYSTKREQPQHTVNLQEYYLGKYPVTQEQYKAVMGTNPSYFKDNPKNPVEQVSWHDAQEFCKKLSQQTGKNYRLPSEAEWEYACRAKSETKYYFGNDDAQLTNYAWYSGNSDKTTHPVGEKKPNNWNLYDMYGNTWEWCEDKWHESYEKKTETLKQNGNMAWSFSNKSSHVVRGGSFFFSASDCRSANRRKSNPNTRIDDGGFRLALSIF